MSDVPVQGCGDGDRFSFFARFFVASLPCIDVQQYASSGRVLQHIYAEFYYMWHPDVYILRLESQNARGSDTSTKLTTAEREAREAAQVSPSPIIICMICIFMFFVSWT